MNANGLPIVAIIPQTAGPLVTGVDDIAVRMGQIGRACEQGMGRHQQLVLANGLLDEVRAAMGETPHRVFVRQESQIGGMPSIVSALQFLNGTRAGEFYCVAADAPVTPQSVRVLRTKLRSSGAAMVLLTRRIGDPDADCDRVLQAQDAPGAEVLAVVAQSAIAAMKPGEVVSFETHDGQYLHYAREQLLGVRYSSVAAYGWQLGPLRKHIGEIPKVGGQASQVADLVTVLRKHRFMVRAFPMDYADQSTVLDPCDLLERAGRACSELVSVASRKPASG